MSSSDVFSAPRNQPSEPRRRQLGTGIAAVLAASGLAAAVVITSIHSPTPAGAATAAAKSVFDVAGRGATVPFLEQEAEGAATNGTVVSGRAAETLAGE